MTLEERIKQIENHLGMKNGKLPLRIDRSKRPLPLKSRPGKLIVGTGKKAKVLNLEKVKKDG